jgi:hypothetical protein
MYNLEEKFSRNFDLNNLLAETKYLCKYTIKFDCSYLYQLYTLDPYNGSDTGCKISDKTDSTRLRQQRYGDYIDSEDNIDSGDNIDNYAKMDFN